MDTANLQIFDSLIRHQIYLLRVSGAVRAEITELLNKTEADMATQVREALRGNKTMSPLRIAKGNRLITRLKAMRAKTWGEVQKILDDSMKKLAVSEASSIVNTIQAAVPVELSMNMPSAPTLRSLVDDLPFEGRTMKQWAETIARQDIQRISDQIKIGIVQGESSSAIARRIVGSAAMRGRDGVTQITRNNASAISRTAVNRYSNAARSTVFADNSDIISKEIFVATLDGRTTMICMSLDGKRFPLGEGPMPPLHWQCRSLRVAEINGQAIGDRPMKPFTQRMLIKEFAEKNQLGRVASRAKLPRGYRGKFDSFASRRVRELTGRIPAKVTYSEWLKRQTPAFQDDVLGKTRADLFRKGETKLGKFVDKSGKTIPVKDLGKSDIGGKVGSALTKEEIGAIRGYVDNKEFKVINSYQRSGKFTPDRNNVPSLPTEKAVLNKIAELESGLDRLPGHEGTSYRGMKFATGREYKEFLAKYTKGSIVKSESFLSTSASKSVVDKYFMGQQRSIMLKIQGKSGKPISDVVGTKLSAKEREILFKRGTEFKVVSRTDTNITLREL